MKCRPTPIILTPRASRLEDVGAVPDSRVGHDFHGREHLRRVAVDLVGDLERRPAVVQLAAAMVANPDGRRALFDRQKRVLDGRDALGDSGERGVVVDLVVQVLGQRRGDAIREHQNLLISKDGMIPR